MVSDVLGILSLSALFLGVILVVLLFIWAFKPAPKGNKVRGNVKTDLKKIKDQINGDE